jgi:hypothetical protein
MKKFILFFSAAFVAASFLAQTPADAQFTDQQMQSMLGAAAGLGQAQSAGEACGTDMAKMSSLIARGWKCQGASPDLLSKLQAAVDIGRKASKVAACPTDKAAHAQQIAKTTAELEAGLAKVNCKG